MVGTGSKRMMNQTGLDPQYKLFSVIKKMGSISDK